MTRRRVSRALEKIRTKVPETDCPVDLATTAPEGRGELGRVVLRDGDGNIRMQWWLRCPFCREMVEIERRRIHMRAAVVDIDDTIACPRCSATYEVSSGRAVLLASGNGGRRRRAAEAGAIHVLPLSLLTLGAGMAGWLAFSFRWVAQQAPQLSVADVDVVALLSLLAGPPTVVGLAVLGFGWRAYGKMSADIHKIEPCVGRISELSGQLERDRKRALELIAEQRVAMSRSIDGIADRVQVRLADQDERIDRLADRMPRGSS